MNKLFLILVLIPLMAIMPTLPAWAYDEKLPPELRNVKVIYVEVIKKAPVPAALKDWQSLDELKQFIAAHKAEVWVQLLPGKDGKAQLGGQCVGEAMGWRDMAEKYGKNLEIQIVSPAEYERAFKKKMTDYHAVNTAIIAQRDIYYFDSADPEYIMLGAVIP